MKSTIEIFEFLSDNFPNLYLMLAEEFSAEIPGILKIDFRAEYSSILEFMKENMEQACRARLEVKKRFKIVYRRFG